MKKRLLLVCVGVSMCIVSSRACDLCGCYTPQLSTIPRADEATAGWYAAIAEQFTHFGTLQRDGDEIDNPTGQYLDSSISQAVIGYDINARFALQVSAPLIYREFKRPEAVAIDRGTVGGLGDVSLLLKAVAFHYASPARRTFAFEDKNPIAVEHEPDFTISTILLTGVKFPTGATSRLKEEFHEEEIPGAPENGIHGHDLTLGTGSYDGIFSVQHSVRYKNVFVETDLQFTLRGDGAHQYHFANDLLWDGGPGYYLVRDRETIIGLQFLVSGEHKDVDRFRGDRAEDTGLTSVFVGPRVAVSHGRWSGEIGAEFPASIDNAALQIVPDYRLRGGISFHF